MGRRARPALPTPCSSPPGATDRRGSVDDGTSISDVDDEEKRRHFTIDCHLLHLEWAGKQIHLIDSPGYPDFIGNALGALAAVENVVVDRLGPAGIEVNTRRIFQEASRLEPGPDHRHHQDGRRQRRLSSRVLDADPRDLRPAVRALQRADRPGPDVLRRRRRAQPARGRARRLPDASVRGVPDGRRADRRDRRGPDEPLPRRRDPRRRRAPRGRRTEAIAAGQARAGRLRLGQEGHRRQGAARPAGRLQPDPGRGPPPRLA